MTDDQQRSQLDQTGAARSMKPTRRGLLVGGGALGIAASVGGAVLAGPAVADPQAGADQGSQGRTRFPDLGDPMPGDMRPDAPELAARGPFHVGVRGFTITNPDQLDVVHMSATSPHPTYNRPLGLQVWYPAKKRDTRPELTIYHDTLGSGPGSAATRPLTPFTFHGRALRGAPADRRRGPYPLLIVSHGYPGSDVLLTNITENLASKGYVVVAINHTDSTHADATVFASTLRNRILDDNFVLRTMAHLGGRHSGSFLAGMVDADRTAILGYSMGGYGALVAAGAGLTSSFATTMGPGDALKPLIAGSAAYAKLLDKRIRTLVLASPWGGTQGAWDAAGLASVKVPMLLIVGDQDQTAPYPGVRSIFDKSVNADRYLLIHQQGDHEVIANPAPPITFTRWREYVHYEEPALDNTRTNNVNQHFVTAFLDQTLKGKDYTGTGDYLNPVYPDSNDSNNYANPDYDAGWPASPIWRGFKVWSAVGLQLRHQRP